MWCTLLLHVMGNAELFWITFLLGLGGAMSPGALLTYTIYQAMKAGKKGYKPGLQISFGHVVIEVILIVFLLLGVAPWIQQEPILIGIGLIGGLLLVFFGGTILRDIAKNRIKTDFLQGNLATSPESTSKDLKEPIIVKISLDAEDTPLGSSKRSFWTSIFQHPFFAGMGFLMSNPYWWLWWATIGVTLLIDNDVSFSNGRTFLVFVVAKELGQILWYTGIAITIGFARQLMTRKIYLAILGICGLFMAGYGVYLAISPFWML